MLKTINIDIDKIDFGRSAAEREEHQLNNYFLSTRAYLNAKKESSRKLFYVGNRGSGKSALFNQLSTDYGQDNNAIIMDLKPSEFSYEIFVRMEHSFFNIKTTYSIAWEYTLLIQILIEVSKHFAANKNIKTNRENIKVINDYLIKHNYLEDGRSLSIFFEYLRKIVDAKSAVTFKGPDGEASTNNRNSPEKKLVSLLHLEDLVQPKSALKNILNGFPVYIFLDELDKGWDNSHEAQNYINGLFEAVYSLSSIKNLNIFVSLRQDMYNNLLQSLRNAEKIREDIEKLQWDRKSLKAVIAKRILCSALESSKEEVGYEVLDAVFDQGVLDYIIDHTLARPREIIEFCNKAQSEYVNGLHLKPDRSRKIDKEIVDTILPEFSNNRISDLCTEYEYEYPNIRHIIHAFEHGYEYYSKTDFLDVVESGLFHMIDLENCDWIKKIDMDTSRVMEILFRIGFIKIFVPAQNAYFASYEVTILDFNRIEKIKIHDVFVPALYCK